jgi:hypothetical protein
MNGSSEPAAGQKLRRKRFHVGLWPCLALLGCGLGQAPGATLYVSLQSTNPVAPYEDWTTAALTIQAAVDAAHAGDEVLVTNGVYQTGGRVLQGLLTNRVVVGKPLTLRSVNGPAATAIQGCQVPGTTNGEGAVRCVCLADNATLIGFTLTNGGTRAVSTNSDCYGAGAWCAFTNAVLSNCVFCANVAYGFGGGSYGGTLVNCTLSNNAVLAWAPSSLFGAGGGTCFATLSNCLVTGNSAYMGGGAYGGALSYCAILNNSAPQAGGGTYASALNNCQVIGNSAWAGGGVASYAFGGPPMNNCLILSNSAISEGGGSAGGVLNNCQIIGNSAPSGGGSCSGTLNNCILYYNNAPSGANYFIPYYGGSLSFCCTTPLPAGSGNITNAPLLVDPPAGDFHLQPNSPCINAGRNSFITNRTDLDGNARIVGGTVDIGAYEFSSPSSVISYAWLQQYGLPSDGTADYADSDGDGLNNWQEWICGTDPTNPLSALTLLSPTGAVSGVIVSWQSVPGRRYFLERSANLRVQPAFLPLASNILGQPDTTSYTDANAAGPGPFFYRVGVQP